MQNQKSMPIVKPRPYLLEGQIQHYAWGTRNDTAFIPKLLGITPEPDLPYAELWIGVHPKAPSIVTTEGACIPLDQWITEYPTEILGNSVASKFQNTLPFLFKVLSAGESLSIQSHPNKTQAEALHARDPEHYRDDNHKPEVAIALDSLMALVGLKSHDALAETLAHYPEIAEFIGEDACEEPLDVEKLFSTLIRRSVTHEAELLQAINSLTARLTIVGTGLTEAETLFLDLRERYPGADVGLFALFLLNIVHLEQGQGIFTGPGIPHAYLKGNIIECMANSDNVVRVGLTPKFKDAPTLLEILDYEPKSVEILGRAADTADNVEDAVYDTPAPEFQVSKWLLKPGATKTETPNGIEVLFVTRGQIEIQWNDETGVRTQTFAQGQAVLIPACLAVLDIQTVTGAEVFKTEVPAH